MTETETPESFYVPDGDGFRATIASRGPWSPQHQHGGPAAALLAGALEKDTAARGMPMRVARILVAFHRPIPIDRFRVTVEALRDGKKVRIAKASLLDESDRAVATAEALFIRTADVGVDASPDPPPPSPESCEPFQFPFFTSPVGYHTAMERRVMSGTFGVGKMALWMRIRGSVVAGEAPTPLQRVVAAADSGNGVSFGLDPARWTFMNPDLTVHLSRDLEGEWVCIDATSRFGADGIGLAETSLLDPKGRIGRGAQSLIIERRG